MKNNFFDKIKGISITDIQQLGAVDVEEGISEITTFHTYIYIIFDGEILKFESIDQYSKLSFQYVDNVEFEIEIEEDMIPTKSSIAEIVLNDTMADNRVESIEIYGADITGSQFCDALSLRLVCGQELFFDPTYFFGINVGGDRQKELWRNNFPNNPSEIIQKESIKLV